MRQIGDLVRRERTHVPMSQAELARAADVDVRAVRGLENGTRWPWDSSRAKIERALNLGVGTLEQWRDHPEAMVEYVEAKRCPERYDDEERDGGVHLRASGSGTAVVQVSASSTNALDQLRAANIAVAAERMAKLPAEDIARVQALIDELGRARFSDWDDDDDYALAWGRRAILRPLAPADEQAVLDSLKDVD